MMINQTKSPRRLSHDEYQEGLNKAVAELCELIQWEQELDQSEQELSET